jgi:hypothetical protein
MAAAFDNLRQLVSGAHPLAPAVPLSDGGLRRPSSAQPGLQPIFYSECTYRSLYKRSDGTLDAQRLVVHPALWPNRGTAVGSASTLRPARKKSISEHLKEKRLEGEMLTLPADGEGTLGDLMAVR